MSHPWADPSLSRRPRPTILRQRNVNTPGAPELAPLGEKSIPRAPCVTNRSKVSVVSSNENKENDGQKKAVKICRRKNPLQPNNNQSVNLTPAPLPPVYRDPVNTVLPKEIQHFIFGKLHFDQLLLCRAVSRDWKASVESFKKFDVIIDDTKDFSGMCTISMKTCEIRSLMAPQNRRLFHAVTPDRVDIVKRISQWNFGEMATKWDDLKTLKIGWKALISVFLFRHCVKYPIVPSEDTIEIGTITAPGSAFFAQLEDLHLDVTTAVEGDIFNVLNQNLGYILQWHYPSLVHITINFLDNIVRQELLSKVSSFIRFHASTLKKVDIQFSNISRRIPRTIPQRSLLFDTEVWDWKNRSQITKGFAIKLSQYSLEYPYKNSNYEIADDSRKWLQVLHRERDLELLIISKLQINIRRAEYFYFYIKMYAEQLTVIELINLSVYDVAKPDKMTPIDMTLFVKCVHLKTLGLWRAPILLNEIMPEASSEILNLHILPRSISSLTIDGLPVQCDDIVKAIANLSRLTKFSYSRAAMPRRNHLPQSGVTLPVMTALLTHKWLSKIEVMTASSVPRDFYSDIENGLLTLAIANRWILEDIKQLWYSCVKITMRRNFNVRRVP